MVDFRQVEAMIQEQIPDAQVMVRDLTGGGDHLEAVVMAKPALNSIKWFMALYNRHWLPKPSMLWH